jgi:hypothetical protein
MLPIVIVRIASTSASCQANSADEGIATMSSRTRPATPAIFGATARRPALAFVVP